MLRRFLIPLACAALCRAASAGAIYSNIGSGFPADSPTAYTAGFTFFGTTFTTAGGGTLASIETDVSFTSGSVVTAGLYTDSSGKPGSLIEAWSVTIPVWLNAWPPAPTILVSTLFPTLAAGTPYWFLFTQAPDTPQIGWWGNDQGVPGGIWDGDSMTGLVQWFGDQAAPAIQLNSTTPKPGTAILLALGCGALIFVRRAGTDRPAPRA